MSIPWRVGDTGRAAKRHRARLRRSRRALAESLEPRTLLSGDVPTAVRPWVMSVHLGRPETARVAAGGHLTAQAAKKPPISVAIDPASDPDGDGVVLQPTVILAGRAASRSKVKLDLGADGTFEQRAKADKKGNFRFTATVPAGTTSVRVQLAKKARKTPAATLNVTCDLTPPTVVILGPGPTSPTSSNLTISGRATDDVTGIARVQVQVDSGPFTDVPSDASGTFGFATSFAADGPHTVGFRAIDRANRTGSTTVVGILFDTTAPPAPAFDLDSASDSAPAGDRATTSGVVTLVGRTEPGARVVLVGPDRAVTADGTGRFAFDGVALAPGTNALTVRATDPAGNASTAGGSFLRIVEGGEGPTILAALAHDTAPGGTVNTDRLTSDPSIAGTVIDASPIVLFRAGLDGTPPVSFVDVRADLRPDGRFTLDRARLEQVRGGPLPDGPHTLHLQAVDGLGHPSGVVEVAFTLDTGAPVLSIQSPSPGLVTDRNVTVAGQSADSGAGLASVEGQVDGRSVFAVFPDESGGFRFDTRLPVDGSADGAHSVRLRAEDRAGNASDAVEAGFTLDAPEPSLIAPPVDGSVSTSVAVASQFLYTGTDPIQTSVAPGTIDPVRAAVIRGQVRDRAGQPIPGVSITVLNHPEFGATQTRVDGMLDLAVNGGGLLTVRYAKAGYLPVQRQVDVPWQDYTWLPDVVMIPEDAQVSVIDLTAATPIQAARGSPVTDQDGTRQATILFPQGTGAALVMSDGTTQALTTLHVRATEYTVGPEGPQAMPAQLPPASAYTYAVELGADETTAAGASGVRFSRSIPMYLENFLGFPTGAAVPSGWYDATRGEWVPEDDGLVLKVLSVTGGLADLDIDGSGQVADASTLGALGITDAERQTLATLYSPGQTLWRVPVAHFSSRDYNFPYACYDDDKDGEPDCKPPDKPPHPDDESPDDPDTACGSIIQVENQALGEAVDIVGTPFRLSYSSERVPGRSGTYTLKVPIDSVSARSFLRTEVVIEVAGRRFTPTFDPASPELTFTWDGRDGFGRVLQGPQPVTVTVKRLYAGIYNAIAFVSATSQGRRFGRPGGAISYPPSTFVPLRDREQIGAQLIWHGVIGGWLADGAGLGGWDLDVHNAYDPVGKTLYLGDGSKRSATTPGLDAVITTVAGTGAAGFGAEGGRAAETPTINPHNVAVGPDGSLYFLEGGYSGNLAESRVRRVDRDGLITTVAGVNDPSKPFLQDGVPATQARLISAIGLAVSRDGSLYIASYGQGRVRRVDALTGIISTVAGGGGGGDGGLATNAAILPTAVAVGPDGSLYISDARSASIRRVGPDGIISTVAGRSTGGSLADFIPATEAALSLGGVDQGDIAVGPDGSLYIADGHRVRRVNAEGLITTVAGAAAGGDGGDGGPATDARFHTINSIAVGPDGSLYTGEYIDRFRIRRVGLDGIITTVVDGPPGFSGDGGPGVNATIGNTEGLTVGPDGNLYIADQTNQRVRRIGPAIPGFGLTDRLIPSEDASEIYVFRGDGRHLRTLDALTGAVLYRFDYDDAGRLTTVTDVDGHPTTIERDAWGNPTAIIAPFGQRTALTLGADGNLALITDPAGQPTRLTYHDGGLLATLTDANQGTHRFSYDPASGRLTRDEDPAGGFTVLSRAEGFRSVAGGAQRYYTVTLTKAEGGVETYDVTPPSGPQTRIFTDARGLRTVTVVGKDGSRTITAPDGTVTTLKLGPDPRFGMAAPVIAALSVRAPSGLTTNASTTRAVALTDTRNPLSLSAQTETTTVDGRTYTSTFVASQRTITSRTPEGRQSVTTLDERGRVTGLQAPDQDPVQFTYDPRGLLQTISQGGRVEKLAYDEQGHLTSLTDPMDHEVLLSDYDPDGRARRRALPDGGTIASAFDALGNLVSISPPGRPAHTFSYDADNRVVAYDPPDVGAGLDSTQYTYDRDGRLTKITRPDGTAIDMTYCDCGRLETLTQPRGTETYTYSDTTGQLTGIASPGGVGLSFAYDGDLLRQVAWTGPIAGTVQYAYDASRRLISESVDGSAVNFQYDRDGLLTQAGELTLARDPASGRLTGTTLGVVSDTLGYDAQFGEVASYRATVAGADRFSVQYTRDALGRIVDKTEKIDGATHAYHYDYDRAGRLTDVARDGVPEAHYDYDVNGNRLGFTGASGTVTGIYDDQDRLLTYGTNVYTYTANGELRTKTDTATGQKTTYTYDALGNLTAVDLPDGRRIEYLIDSLNRRIGKKVDGVLVQGFLYDDGHTTPVAELDASGKVLSRFVYSNRLNVPDYMVKGGRTYRIISDRLGSPRLVIDDNTGDIVQRIDYDAFGEVTIDTNPHFQPIGFDGGLYDQDTGLLRFGARDFDPTSGRWTTKDPILFGGDQGNLYAYAGQDPIDKSDPRGLQSTCEERCPDDRKPGEVPDPDLGSTFRGLTELTVWLYIKSPMAKVEKTAFVGVANIAAQIGATEGEIVLLPFTLTIPERLGQLQYETLWEIVQSGFNDVYRHIWDDSHHGEEHHGERPDCSTVPPG